MAPRPPASSLDRRTDAGLRFDPTRGRLRLGRFSVLVPPDAGNAAVLAAYVELAARARGDRIAHLVDVRHDDVEALARALDLDAADLAAQIELVLGASRAEAVRLIARLRESRVIGGIAKAATVAGDTGT